MTPRVLLTTIGATALGFGLVISGAPAIPDVFAQEATPPAAVAPAQTEQEIDFEAQRAQTYDSFVAALASELGSDEAAVDTKAPWHFKLLVLAVVLYLGWRLIQMLGWVIHQF